jgi:hypothetical protein
MNLAARQALDQGIEMGRGGIWLELSDDQYQKLIRAGTPKSGPPR